MSQLPHEMHSENEMCTLLSTENEQKCHLFIYVHCCLIKEELKLRGGRKWETERGTDVVCVPSPVHVWCLCCLQGRYERKTGIPAVIQCEMSTERAMTAFLLDAFVEKVLPHNGSKKSAMKEPRQVWQSE